MARIDKTDSAIGVFRAAAEADAVEADYEVPLGAALNAAGRVVTGAAGQTGFKGLVLRDRTTRKAGKILDVLTTGELVEVDGLVAGTNYYLNAATGVLQTAASRFYVGHTVEADRLVVRFQDLYEIAGV